MPTVDTIAELLVRMRADDAHLVRGLRRSQKKLKVFGKTVGKLGQSVGKLNALLGGLTIGAGFAVALRDSAKFEYSMQKIVGLVGLSQKRVNNLSKATRRLAVTLGKDPKQMAEALFQITSAGIHSTAQAMDVLEASTKASIAGLGEITTIADAATSAMNAYGADTLSASDATDVLVAAVREGKLEASQLASSMGQVISQAKLMGVSFAEAAGVVAGLSRIGIRPAEAVTGLRAALQGLTKPTKESEEWFGKLGYNVDKLMTSIRENGFVNTLDDIKTRLKELNLSANEMNLAWVQMFPNIEAQRAILGLVGEMLEKNKEIVDNVEKSTGATEAAFGAQSQGSIQNFNEAMARLREIGMTIGDKVLPPIVTWIDKMTKGITGLKDATVQWGDVVTGMPTIEAGMGPAEIEAATRQRMIYGDQEKAKQDTLLEQGYKNWQRGRTEQRAERMGDKKSEGEVDETHPEINIVPEWVKDAHQASKDYSQAVEEYKKILKTAEEVGGFTVEPKDRNVINKDVLSKAEARIKQYYETRAAIEEEAHQKTVARDEALEKERIEKQAAADKAIAEANKKANEEKIAAKLKAEEEYWAKQIELGEAAAQHLSDITPAEKVQHDAQVIEENDRLEAERLQAKQDLEDNFAALGQEKKLNRFDQEREQADEKFQETMDMLNEQHEMLLIGEEEFERKKDELKQLHANKRKEIDEKQTAHEKAEQLKRWQEQARYAVRFAGNLERIAQAFGKHSKALYFLNKAAKFTQAVIDAFAAYNKYLSEQNPVMAKWALATGLSNAAAIAATAFGGGGGAGGGGSSAPGESAASYDSGTAVGGGSNRDAGNQIDVRISGIEPTELITGEQLQTIIDNINEQLEDGASIRSITAG